MQTLDVPQYTQFIFGLMKIVDYGKPTTGKFYENYDSLIERSHAMEEGFIRNVKKKVVNILNDWWYFMHSPMYFVGIVLDPEWRGIEQEFFLKQKS